MIHSYVTSLYQSTTEAENGDLERKKKRVTQSSFYFFISDLSYSSVNEDRKCWQNVSVSKSERKTVELVL